MCGRFALGLQADDLPPAINHQYFARRQNNRGGADDVDREEDADSGQEHEEQQESGSGSSEQAQSRSSGQHSSSKEQVGEGTVDGPVRWSSLEGQAGYRVRYNVCPKSRSVVLRKNDKSGQYELDLLLWGLVPSWFKEPPAAGLSTINAQCESVFEGKPSWRGPRENRRCVVIAQGFYEWLQKGKDKVPHFVKRQDGKLMAFAGLWDHCDYKGAFEPVTTYTILTTPVNPQLRFLHSRMPAILNDASEIELWLSNNGWNDKVKSLVRPFEGKVECYPVDKGVGKVGNESEDYIKPVAAKKGSLDTMFAKQSRAQSTNSSPTKPHFSSSIAAEPASTSPSSSSKPKLKSASPPTPSTIQKGEAKKEHKGEGIDEAMNPDEDSPGKVIRIAKAEEEAEKREDARESARKRKNPAGEAKEEVEVLDLAHLSDGEEEEEKKPPPKKVKTSFTKKGKKAKEEKHFDDKGNEALTNFFPVVD